MQLTHLFAIGLGGAVGALSRFALNELVVRKFPESAYWGTFTVNFLGCLLIGFLMTIIAENQKAFPEWLFFLLVTGFLGSLTTFSTFGYQTMDLILKARVLEAVISVSANLFLGLIAVIIGRLLAFPWSQ